MKEIDEKMQQALKTYIVKYGMGKVLDNVIRPVFTPCNLKVIISDREKGIVLYSDMKKPTKS